MAVTERDHSARLSFARALAAFQSQCPAVPRSSKAKIQTRAGTTFEYAYADFEQIVETITPHLRANGLSFSFDSEAEADKLRCVCRLTHIDGHGESSSFTLPTATASAMSAQQAVGAALTFAKRQALTAVLGLALTDPDPDGVADPTTIDEGQQADLRALVEEVGADMVKVLAYARVKDVSQIRVADLPSIVTALEARRLRGKA